MALDFYYENDFATNNGATIVITNSTFFSFRAFNLNDSISLNTFNIRLNYGWSASSATGSATFLMGLYSMNAGTLSLENSGSASHTVTLAANVQQRDRWMQITTFSKTQNITPGTWYLGYHVSFTADTATAIYTLGVRGDDPPGSINNAFPGAFIAGNATGTTNAPPSSYATSALDITGQHEMNQPFFIITAI